MKTILYKPLFVNPQAYSILPCIQYPEKGEETNIEANYTGTLTITDSTGLIRSYQNQKVIDLGEYQGIITIDNVTLDGAVRLGQWDISGIDTFVKPIASYRCYDKTNDDEDRAVLKDLTDNGHDIQLYNFSFAESSGYGKYGEQFNILKIHNSSVVKTYKKIEVTKELTTSYIVYNQTRVASIDKMKVKISNLPKDRYIIYTYKNEYDNTAAIQLKITSDGIYNLPGSIKTSEEFINRDYGFTVERNNITGYIGLTIELLPEYQGALVSDGVDDYGLCENFPIFTKEKGYTVCVIRKILGDITSINVGLASKRRITDKDGAFQFERFVNGTAIAINFGKNNYPVVNLDTSFVCQTSNSYNGQNLVNKGDGVDNNIFSIFTYNAYSPRGCINSALYALEIYDRDLTDEEIAKVKARMIAEYEEKTGNKYEEKTV